VAPVQAQISSLKAAHFSNLAMCHLRLGNTEKARDCCTKAIGIDPDNVKVPLLRAGHRLLPPKAQSWSH
jgi:Tfp pilus assembly protein PilF